MKTSNIQAPVLSIGDEVLYLDGTTNNFYVKQGTIDEINFSKMNKNYKVMYHFQPDNWIEEQNVGTMDKLLKIISKNVE